MLLWFCLFFRSGLMLSGGDPLDFLPGRVPADGVIYLPLGYHTRYSFNLSDNQLLGLVFQSAAAGTFINSFGDRAAFFGTTRELTSGKGRLGLDYFAGLVVGYHGRLKEVDGMPFRQSVLFRGNVNPALAMNLHYRISTHFRAQVMLTPLVFNVGIKYGF
jgi:hypothetical protein